MGRSILPKSILESATREAAFLANNIKASTLRPPTYDPQTYYKDITESEYFDALLVIRHYVKVASDVYFGEIVGAKNVDLFMMTPSISSPMGPGSDSEAVPITFGDLKTYLVDSSQFGFEPLLMKNIDKVYCFLPAMRGEDLDKRQLT